MPSLRNATTQSGSWACSTPGMKLLLFRLRRRHTTMQWFCQLKADIFLPHLNIFDSDTYFPSL